MPKQDKSFVSELDKMLRDFDEKNPVLSESQKKEIKKHNRIAELRDDPNSIKVKDLFKDL